MSTWEELTCQENFSKFTVVILNGCHLIINGQPYRICEIELYYFCSLHPDQYVHQDQLQLAFGHVYFHRYKNGTYKSGTYKGMDLSFGRKSENIYLSILVR